MTDTTSICFTCGQAVGDPPRINRTPEGKACPACRDRLLDALPPLLPGSGSVVEEPEPAWRRLEDEDDGSDDPIAG